MNTLNSCEIHHHLSIGTFHTNHCEDYVFYSYIGNRLVTAVMDGCTMGTDSYLVATLIGKLLRKICNEQDLKEFATKNVMPLSGLLYDIMSILFKELKQLRGALDLKREELLSTLLISVIDVNTKNAEVLVVGDSIVICNGSVHEFEQDNQPDYLGYHLDATFDDWYKKQQQRLSFNAIGDISLATDGITSFKKAVKGEFIPIDEKEIIKKLVIDVVPSQTKEWFRQVLISIEREHGLKVSDDLGVVRVVL